MGILEIEIQDCQTIVIRENGNEHNVSLNLSYWGINDLLTHWAYETHQLLDGYCTKLLFLGMVKPKSTNHIRALRAIRTTSHIHFDDVYIQSPWIVHSWNPKDIINYISSNKYQVVYDYEHNLENRISAFSIQAKELEEWHCGNLEKSIPDGFESKFELCSSAISY